jgi:UDP-N-acetylmuramoyl-tripeptide--D-alanyl-D-alanine ligase
LRKATLNIEDLFELPTATIYSPDNFKPVHHVVIDSKKTKKGSLFIAIKGKRFDGHNFVKEAVRKGAGVVVISKRKLNEFDSVNVPIITVQNTLKALGDIAKMWRRKLSKNKITKVVGLTGSSGKTSVKEILSTLLSEKYTVQKTVGNNNNNIGVPLTVLSANEIHDVLVAEVGTNHFGEIKYSADILQPDYSLITNIDDSHLEFLRNRKGVLKEKLALFDATIENEGKIFINYDDPLLRESSRRFKNKISYGFSSGSVVKGRIIDYNTEGKPTVEIKFKNKKYIEILPLPGRLSADNYLAAVSIALELGITKQQLMNGTKKLFVPDKRINIKHFRDFILIDDSYNANPGSVKAVLEMLEKMSPFKRKIVVLGDMLELGKDKIKLHRSLSSSVIKNRIDELYTIGSEMKTLADYLKEKKIISKHFGSRKSLSDFLKNLDLMDSIILVKGSRGMRMEEFSKIISGRMKN